MYKVLHNGKRHKAFGGTCFKTYDAARNAIRKYLRTWFDASVYSNSNPAISDFGFSVKKI
jgi:hypothetical protein